MNSGSAQKVKAAAPNLYFFHRIVYFFLRRTAAPFIRRVLRFSCEKRREPGAPSIIVCNHNTDLDPALVASGFSRHMYFLASEHAFRKGFASSMLAFFLSPIAFSKSKTDVRAIKEVLRRLKRGASVCIFAEGGRSFNGLTESITVSTAKLIKNSGASLFTFRIEGGYFTSPRWAKHGRRGKMTGIHAGAYTAEELKPLTAQQITDIIDRDIHEDAYERQSVQLIPFQGKNLAENIETVLYLCPKCKKTGTVRSQGDHFFCGCGLEGVYSETGFLSGVGLPFDTVTQWDKWQAEELTGIVTASGGDVICLDNNQSLYLIDKAKGSSLIGKGTMEISRDIFRCAGMVFPTSKISRFTVTGQMTLVFSCADGNTYEVKSCHPRSAYKYLEIFRILKESR